jgi:hypothetical protein
MSAIFVEALCRYAAQSMTRRGSLLTLAGTLATAVATPSIIQAEKNNGQKKKKDKKNAERKAAEQAEQARQQAEQAELARQQAENQANQVCANQVAGCRAEILSNCVGPQCFAAAECCTSLGTCNTTQFFSCLVTTLSAEN